MLCYYSVLSVGSKQKQKKANTGVPFSPTALCEIVIVSIVTAEDT